jgi:hypothetical protein
MNANVQPWPGEFEADNAVSAMLWEDLDTTRTTGRRWRIRFTHWTDDEDEHGYYRISGGEWIWPMTYATRRAAQVFTAEACADNYGDLEATIEREPPASPLTSTALRRLIRRALHAGERGAK